MKVSITPFLVNLGYYATRQQWNINKQVQCKKEPLLLRLKCYRKQTKQDIWKKKKPNEYTKNKKEEEQ